MRWWLAPIILALLVGSGCGTSSSSSSEAPPLARIPLSAMTTAVTGGTAAQRRIARVVLAGLGRPLLRFVRLEAPEKRMRPFSKGEVVITAIGQPNDLQAGWKAWLFAGAFNQLAYERGIHGAVMVQTKGEADRLGAWDGSPTRPAPGPPRGGDARKLAAVVRSSAVEAAAQLLAFRILDPYALAPAITLRVTDPAPFLRYRLARFIDGLGDRWALYDGTYIHVVDAAGSFVWATAGATRMSIGGGGTRPELEGCVPYGGIAPPLHWDPPPCPL